MFNFFRVLFSPIVAVLDFITKYFKTIVFLTIVYFLFFSSSDNQDGFSTNSYANLQKIELNGPIMNVDETLEQINQAKSNPNIKGVLFVVNSPGGAVSPSVELAYAIKSLKEKKPVVTYASGTIASGSYYASIWSNKIIANPGSTVGSIGVILSGYNAEELMDKVGLKTQVVKAGKYKESGTFSRPWTSYEKEHLQSVIDDTYKMFVSDVAKARGLKVSNSKEYANAKIFTSSQAKKVGLIDAVATIDVAKEVVIKLAKVKKPIWNKKDKYQKFIDKIIQNTISQIAINFSPSLKAY